MHYNYPVNLLVEPEGVTATFDGLSGVTFAASEAEALREAADLLVSCLSIFVDEGKEIPAPGEANGRPMVSVTVLEAAKLALHDAMVAGNISNVDLARRLGLSESIVRRLRDPLYSSKMDKVEAALHAVGRRAVVEFVELEPA